MLVQKSDANCLYLRGAVYCFRWVIPTDLRPYLGVRELKRSLQTPLKRTAIARAQSLFGLVEQLIQLKQGYQMGVVSEPDFIDGIREARASISPKHSLVEVEPDKLFHEALQAFLESKLASGLTDRMAKEYQRNTDTLIAISKNLPVRCIDSVYVKELLSVCAQLPKRNVKAYQGKSISELLKMDVPAEDRISEKTVSHMLKYIQGFFVHARSMGLSISSPAKNLNCKSSDDLGHIASKAKGDICSIALS